jgi:alpha-mannosidase
MLRHGYSGGMFRPAPLPARAAATLACLLTLALTPLVAVAHDESLQVQRERQVVSLPGSRADSAANMGLPRRDPAAREHATNSVLAGKRYYIANDDHTDYEWAGTDVQYRSAFQTMLDFYMDQAESTASNPIDQRGRFNCDGSIWVREYEANRSAADFQRLVSHLRAGDITMPLNTLVQLYGAMPAEAVLRSFYYAGRLERRLNMRFPLVVPMEDQTLPGGVASLWAGSGAKYSWKGICNCATQIDASARPLDIYRFTGPDGQSVLMKWYEMYGTNKFLGGYAEARDPVAAVQYMKSDPTFLARWPYDVSGAFGYGWDDLQSTTDAFVAAALSESDSTHRVIVSNEVDFFQDFDAEYGSTLTNVSVGYGNEWDLLPASMAEVSAQVKRSVEKLRTAEALATIATLANPSFMDALTAMRDSADMSCGLYFEHSWGPGPGVDGATRAAWQRGVQHAITFYVDSLQSLALADLASRVRAPAGVERHLVFNPLSWVRTDIADLAIAQPLPVHVVDLASGAEVPSQPLTIDGQPRLRILASQVPSVGYRVYEVRAGAGAAFPPSATITLPAMDNGIYRVTVGPRGQLTSVIDHKDGDRELVGAGGSILELTHGGGTAVVENSGPVTTTLRVTAGGVPAHECRISLHTGLDRIDVDARVTQNFSIADGYDSHFNLPGFTMRHEEVGKINVVARAAQGGDYADQDTRTDYLTLNHFVDLSEDTRGVTLSSWDSEFFKAGNSTPTFLDTSTPSVSAILGMQVDGGQLGIANQGGDSFFLDRFALRTHGAWSQPAAMRFALEHQNPFVAARILGSPGSPMPDTTYSLMTIDNPDVMMWALKPAEEDGAGVIVRLWNLADGHSTASVLLPSLALADARQVTHIETDLGPVAHGLNSVTDDFAREQMMTFRLYPAAPPTSIAPLGARTLALSARPNPAPSLAQLEFDVTLVRAGRVRLTLHDVHGARVMTIAEGWQPAGHRVLRAPARSLPPGIYFARLECGGSVVAQRVALLR